MQSHKKKTATEIHFIYLDNKEIYCTLRLAAQPLFYFPQNAIHFIILSFSVQIIVTCFVNNAQKFKHKPGLQVVLLNSTILHIEQNKIN
jgi:hypothetical protein